MWLDEDAPIRKRDFVLEKPFVNASGTLGFAPDAHAIPFLDELGAFITNPISRHARQPAGSRGCVPFPGGFLLHTGWPNPGIRRAIAKYRRAWAAATLPVIVHLLGESPQMIFEMVRKLEGLDNLFAVEIGLPPDCSPALLRGFLDASEGELPRIISLKESQMTELLAILLERQPAAVHLLPPRGALPDAAGNLVSGRLYGPAIFAQTLETVLRHHETGLQIIASGGVFTRENAQAVLEAGAFAVGLGAVLWGVEPASLFM